MNETFFETSTRELAQDLLGKTLVRRLPDGELLSCILVEVEAYLDSGDPASHSSCGLTKRNAAMFETAGTLYVYSIHTRHCINVVARQTAGGAAVLLRGAEPLTNWQPMWRKRLPQEPLPSKLAVRDAVRLTQGPGRLSEAMQIELKDNFTYLPNSPDIWLEDPADAVGQREWKICRSPRIGISKAQDLMLRFFIDGNRFVSGCARDHSHGRNWTFTIDSP